MDVRLIPAACGVWLATSIVVVASGHIAPQQIAALFAMLAVVVISSEGMAGAQWKLIGLAMLCGSAVAFLRVWPLHSHPIRAAAASHLIVHIEATVSGDPIVFTKSAALDWASSSSAVVPMTAHSVTVNDVVTRGSIPISAFSTGTSFELMRTLVPGTQVSLSGKLFQPKAGQPVAAALSVSDIVISRGPPRYQSWADYLRSQLRGTLTDEPSDAQALVPGLALGDSERLNPELKSAMQESGLTHLIAVSGANVSLLIAVIMRLTRRRNRTMQAVLVILALVAFVIVVRPQPSVLRATVMGLVVVIGHYIGARSSPLPALAGAVIGLVLLNPWLALSYGFMLSTLATAGLILMSHRLVDTLDRYLWRGIPRWLIEVLAVTMCAQLAVLPVMVALGAPLSFASIPANMLAVPLATPAMLLGLVAALIALVSVPVAHIVVIGAVWPAIAIGWIARRCSTLTWLTIPWPHGPQGVALAVVMVAAVVHGTFLWSRLDQTARQTMIASVLTVTCLLWFPVNPEFHPWPGSGWIMVACDVGQGDGAVFRVGPHDGVVIDVGPDPTLMNSCLRKLHIRHISLLVLTHFHADHVGGIDGAIRGRIVDQAWVTALPEPELTASFAMRELRDHHIPTFVSSFPQHIVIGSLDITCLWPSRIIRGQGSDPNNASIVLLIKTLGHTIVMSGDVEPAAQQALVSQFGSGLHADVLKVPHHGSPHQDAQFAAAVHPRDAIISVGLNNDYGHPAQSTIAMYQALGATVWRTDRQGAVAVVWDGHHLGVRAQR